MRLLRRDPVIQSLWQHYLINEVVPSGISRDTWKRQIATAHLWLANMPDETEVSMMCEVQMVLKKYSTTRTAMHELYKVVRVDTANDLYKDFATYARAFRVKQKKQEAGDSPMKLVCRDGLAGKLETLLPDMTEHNRIEGLLIACEHVRPRCVKLLLGSQVLSTKVRLPTT